MQEDDYFIVLDDGIYNLDEPIIFDDWVSSTRSITLIAKDNSHPIIQGGRKVTTWETHGDESRIIKAHVDCDHRDLIRKSKMDL